MTGIAFATNRFLLPCLALFAAIITAPTLEAFQQEQENPNEAQAEEVIDQIVDFGDHILVVKDVAKFERRGRLLFKDVGVDPDLVRWVIRNDGKTFDLDQPAIFYRTGWQADKEEKYIGKFRLQEGMTPDFLATDPRDNPDPEIRAGAVDWSSPIPARKPDFGMAFDWGYDPEMGAVQDGVYLAADSVPTIEEFNAAPPLREKLTPKMTQLLNESGIATFVWNRKENDLHLLSPPPKDHLSEGEKEFGEKLVSIGSDCKCAGIGMTYDHRRVRFNSIVTLTPGELLDSTIDTEIAKRPFAPTFGLPEHELLFALSLRNSCFHSPAAVSYFSDGRVWGFSNRRTLPGQALLNTVTAIISGVHDEIDGFRLAMYETPEDVRSTHCVIGIIDSVDGDVFLKQFGEMVQLTSTPAGPELKAQIETLIGQLDDQKFRIRQAATNRLRVIGKPALEQLESAFQTDGISLEQKTRIKQLIDRIAGFRRQDPDLFSELKRDQKLWAEFQPTFSIGKTDDFEEGLPTFLLTANPPEDFPVRAWEEISTVIGDLFGREWNQVRLVQVGNRFVFMQGADTQRLKETIGLVRAGSDPLKEQDADRHIDLRDGEFQLRGSTHWIYRMIHQDGFECEEEELAKNHQCVFNIEIDESEVQASLFLPAEEIKLWLGPPYGFGW